MTIKRASIYFFFNAQGFVPDYVLYYLQEIKKLCAESCVVVNEPLSSEGRSKLKKCCDTLLVRENVGFDSAAYKYAIKYYGYNYIKQNFDELILNNFTCYGPLYPFSEMFDEMERRECDLWGVSAHPAQNSYLIPGVLDSKVIKHIQSYFIAFKSSILSSSSFEDYWETLRVPYSYQQAVLFHELRCSNYFEKRGFKTDTFINFNKYKNYEINCSIYLADRWVKFDRLPVVKRKVFFLKNQYFMYNSWGHIARDLLDFIDRDTSYDVNLLWQDLIKTQKMSVLRNNLHLNYYLPTDYLIGKPEVINSVKTALVVYVSDADQIGYIESYISHMPRKSDIYVISVFQSILDLYKKGCGTKFAKKYKFYFQVMKENRGTNWCAYLVTAADVFKQYDYICLAHDCQPYKLPERYMEDEYRYYCWTNNLASSQYVENVIQTFEQNPKLGMLVPPVLNFGPFFSLLSDELGSLDDKKFIGQLYKDFGLSVPFDEHPVAPFGSMFWVRGKSFGTILSKHWIYDDFTKEHGTSDRMVTLKAALECLCPLTVQESGYYVGYLATQSFASLQNDNNHYYLSQLLSKLFSKHPGRNTLFELLNDL